MGSFTALMVAGTDPLGGAGVLADARAVLLHGGTPLVVETAIVDQDSTGVHGFTVVDPMITARRVRRTLADVRVDGVKLGMLGSADVALALVEVLRDQRLSSEPLNGAPLISVLDPVLAAGAGDGALARDGLLEALHLLGPELTLVTPNVPELEALTGRAVDDLAGLLDAGQALADRWGCAVFAKGGHLRPAGQDVVLHPDAPPAILPANRPWPVDVHGTGCHLSTATLCWLLRGCDVVEAADRGRRWLDAMVRAGEIACLGRGRPQFVPSAPQHLLRDPDD